MLDFIGTNFSTILVSAVVAAILVSVVITMIYDKKKGKSHCGCNCANCPRAEAPQFIKDEGKQDVQSQKRLK